MFQEVLRLIARLRAPCGGISGAAIGNDAHDGGGARLDRWKSANFSAPAPAIKRHQTLAAPKARSFCMTGAKRAPVLAPELCSLWGLTLRKSRMTIDD
jgi:hypothetical protein